MAIFFKANLQYNLTNSAFKCKIINLSTKSREALEPLSFPVLHWGGVSVPEYATNFWCIPILTFLRSHR